MPTYTLTLSPEQAKAVCKSVELLLRLKIGQYEELPFALCQMGEGFCGKRDAAKPHLKQGFEAMLGERPEKDQEWNRLYDILQVMRYAIHDAEHPWTTGVDSYPPICTSGEPLPKMRAGE